MKLVRSATISYETPDGDETVDGTEVVFDEGTAHWQLRPESGTVIRIPRERVYYVSGKPDRSNEHRESDTESTSSEETTEETDEYGHPVE